MSIVADSDSPGGAGPIRSVKTPTICGRRFGSANPLRCSLPVVGSVSPTNVGERAGVGRRDLDALTSGAPITRARGTLATTTLRSVMSTRCGGDVDEQRVAVRPACRPSGAVPSTVPPFGGIERITSHGTVAVIDTGTCEISGAVTSLS